MLLQTIHRVLIKVLEVERRLEPFFRPQLNYLLREPTSSLVQYLINLPRKDEGLALAEEKLFAYEEESLDAMIDLMAEQMRGHFKAGRPMVF